MGRPPIGKRAMSGAERIQRWRLRHGKDKPVTKLTRRVAAAKIAALEKKLAQAHARIEALRSPQTKTKTKTKTKTARRRTKET
jgi:hypothetical protein